MSWPRGAGKMTWSDGYVGQSWSAVNYGTARTFFECKKTTGQVNARQLRGNVFVGASLARDSR